MRKTLVTRLLMLALVFMLTLPMPALADGCALCGEETYSETYLCANCLLALLEEKDISGGLEISGAALNADGSVTLAWTDAADNGPYGVYYELLQAAPVPFGWTAATGVTGHEVTMTKLVPGMSYLFSVVDAAGNKAEYIYYAPVPEAAERIGTTFRIHTRIRRNEKELWLPFYASEVMADNGEQYGLYMKMNYSMLKRTRHYAFSLTVEAPNGFADVILSGALTLNYGKSEVPAWGFIPMDDFFADLERYYGEVPLGEYLVTLHFDGKPAYTVPFTVKERQ